MTTQLPSAPSLLSEKFAENPYPLYEVMRNDFPIYYEEGMNAWVLSRYEDVARAFKDPAYTNRNYEWQLGPAHGRTIVQMEGKEHATKRALVAPRFRGRELLSRAVPLIEQASRDLIDDFIKKGHCDFSAEYAQLFPINVVANMMALPISDLEQFRSWYTALIEFLGNIGSDPEVQEAGYRARDEMMDYMLPIIADRRANPGDDLLSSLCLAEVEGTKMTDKEIKAFCSLLLTAGGETTDKALTSLMVKLLQHPEQLADVRRDRSLITAAFAETLRLAPPLQMVMRETGEEVELYGNKIPAGQTIVCLMASANRDPAKFSNPDAFDIHRAGLDAAREFTGATEQLAFVQGRHFCVGAQLAKAEVEIGIGQFLDAAQDIRMKPGFEPVEVGVFTRAPRALELEFTSTR